MFFILSKLLIYLLNPLIWILGGLCVALFASGAKVRQRSLSITFIVLLIFTNPFLLYKFSQFWDVETGPLTKNQVYSCAIVLGGFSSEDGKGEGFFNAAADRFIQALKLKNTGQVSHLLLTGGNSKIIPGKFRESVWVKGQLK